MFTTISNFLRKGFFERTFNLVDLLFVILALRLGPVTFFFTWMIWILFVSPILTRIFYSQKSETNDTDVSSDKN